MDGLTEIAEFVKGHVQAEKVGEVGGNGSEHGCIKEVIGHAQVDKRGQRLS